MSDPNRHIVDQLADVRVELKTLGDREGDLKKQINDAMKDADFLQGDEYIAVQVLGERKGPIDETALQRAGVDVDKFRKPKITTYSLKVTPRTAPKKVNAEVSSAVAVETRV